MPSRPRPASGARAQRPLWQCPKCGRWFVTRNLSHSCARYPLAWHFRGKPRARVLFDAFRAAVEAIGPVRVVPNKTRIAFYLFELRSPRDLTAEIRRYLRESYDVGCQRHLAGLAR